jgi:hypothetical protein
LKRFLAPDGRDERGWRKGEAGEGREGKGMRRGGGGEGREGEGEGRGQHLELQLHLPLLERHHICNDMDQTFLSRHANLSNPTEITKEQSKGPERSGEGKRV